MVSLYEAESELGCLHGAEAGKPMCHAAFVICRGIVEHSEAMTLQRYF